MPNDAKNSITLPNRADAFALLRDLGAPLRLVRHVELVGEAAETLLDAFAKQGVYLDDNFVRIGVVLHDVGKIVHQNELSKSGSEHESAGERLLLDRGVPAKIARVCRSHAQWASLDASLEEFVIALADKLWKGVRVQALEEQIVERAAMNVKRDKWNMFIELDSVFEEIASQGDARLSRSLQ
jgi:predicted hydrolase (HD superfamily)